MTDLAIQVRHARFRAGNLERGRDTNGLEIRAHHTEAGIPRTGGSTVRVGGNGCPVTDALTLAGAVLLAQDALLTRAHFQPIITGLADASRGGAVLDSGPALATPPHIAASRRATLARRTADPALWRRVFQASPGVSGPVLAAASARLRIADALVVLADRAGPAAGGCVVAAGGAAASVGGPGAGDPAALRHGGSADAAEAIARAAVAILGALLADFAPALHAATAAAREARPRISWPAITAAIRTIVGITLTPSLVAQIVQGVTLNTGRAVHAARRTVRSRLACAGPITATRATHGAGPAAALAATADSGPIRLRFTAAIGAGGRGAGRTFALCRGQVAGLALGAGPTGSAVATAIRATLLSSAVRGAAQPTGIALIRRRLTTASGRAAAR